MIGDEILSGRTVEANIALLARKLDAHGIPLRECRIVPDQQDAIITALNELRSSHAIVFTSGGIGPTHDDITAASVAKAFSVQLTRSQETERALRATSKASSEQALEARLRMADVPDGSSLIKCSATAAPGFQIENVFVLAGVPFIFAAMLEVVLAGLPAATAIASCSLRVAVGESEIANLLAKVQQQFPDVQMGSYPKFIAGKYRSDLVARAANHKAAEAAMAELARKLEQAGINWESGKPADPAAAAESETQKKESR